MKSKTALVTGAQQGIGRATALALARTGAVVIANYFDDTPAAESLAGEIQALGTHCHLIKGDLSTSKGVASMLAEVDAIGPVDILINNAATFPRKHFLDVSESLLDNVMAINLKAPFLCTQHITAGMVRDKRKGVVINISSGAAFRGSPDASHYVTTKAGLVGLTRAVALELAPNGIRVNAVAPGLTDTAQPRIGMNETQLQAMSDTVPLGQMATADEVANIVVFLASSEASHVTGQTWHVNGGTYLA